MFSRALEVFAQWMYGRKFSYVDVFGLIHYLSWPSYLISCLLNPLCLVHLKQSWYIAFLLHIWHSSPINRKAKNRAHCLTNVFFLLVINSDVAPVGGSKPQLSSSVASSSSLPPPPPSSAAPLLPPSGGDTEDDEGMKHLQQVGTTGSTCSSWIWNVE